MAASLNLFPKAYRVCERRSFIILAKSFLQYKSPSFYIQWIPNTFGYARLGITVTKKFGSSVQRNYYKRIIREAFRTEHIYRYSIGIDFNIRPRKKGVGVSLEDAKKEIEEFLKKVEATGKNV